jgi:selenocysteine lyase/cysteine desulfurase
LRLAGEHLGENRLMTQSFARTFDIERARRETRGCESLIHFNNAGTSLPPAPVTDKLYGYLREEELEGGYEVMARRAAELEHFYSSAAQLLNCRTEEIAFADSAGRAWTAAFYAFDFRPGDRVLVGRAEYGSNLVALLHQVRQKGIEIVPLPDDEAGQTDVAALENLIDNRTRLICLTQAPSGNGLINPAAAVGRIAGAAKVPFLLDACQALGQLPVDVEAIGCDLLCGTGRKFLRGPRGTGLLYVRNSLLEQLKPAQLNHHAAELIGTDSYRLRQDARRFESWERSYAGQLALGVAIDYALEWGLQQIRERVQTLARLLREQLAKIDSIEVTDLGIEQSGIVSFYVKNQAAQPLQLSLATKGFNISLVPDSANPLLLTPPVPPRLRASVHYYNTEAEIARFTEWLTRLILA